MITEYYKEIDADDDTEISYWKVIRNDRNEIVELYIIEGYCANNTKWFELNVYELDALRINDYFEGYHAESEFKKLSDADMFTEML